MKKLLLYVAIAVFLISICLGLSTEYSTEALWLFVIASLLLMFHAAIDIREK